MKLIIPLFLFIVQTPVISHAQALKGNIVDSKGEAIPFATVYIKELKQGTSANIKGDYELKVQPGKYTVTYQSMGYEPSTSEIIITEKPVINNVVLQLQYYQISEVRISASGEDPAYAIMRKAIGMAPYYQNNLNYYRAEVYLKGNLLISRIPKILEKTLKRQQKKGGSGPSFKKGDPYFMESFNEIEFNAPDKYSQKVLSINSTFPSEGNEISPMTFINASFYEPELADMAISPLSPSAFSHYKFKYAGQSFQGNNIINKIQVIPKRKSQQLFEGTIYIIEDLWCLQSIDLVNENLTGKIHINQLFIPVQDDIWMPVSHNFEFNISIMGVKADASYSSSVKYMEVRPNTALLKPNSVPVNFTSKKQGADTEDKAKSEKKIEKILSKDKISNGEMMKLSRLMKKESEKSHEDSVRNNREISGNIINRIEKDANKKDSAYWSGIRPIPLSEIEKRSIRISDSLKGKKAALREMKKDTTLTGNQEEKRTNKVFETARYIATGHTWSDTTGQTFRFRGLADLKNFSFNTVDGFTYGLNMSFTKRFKNKSLYISPDFKWAFSREKPIWNLNSIYSFNHRNWNSIYLRAGKSSNDINRGGGINLFLNSDLSLIFRKNYLKLYESGYLTFGYSGNIAFGLNMDISANFEERRMLTNTTNFSLFRSGMYTPNVVVNDYLLPGAYPFFAMRNMRHAGLTTRLTYTPFQKYRLYKGKKIPAGSDWPVFSLTWEHGINEFAELADKYKQFDMLRFEASKKIDPGAFSEIKWRLRTGGFINNRYVTFYDFYHVNSQPIPVLLNNYEDAFMLPAYYSMSTPEYFVQAHVKYTTPYLLLKYLPGLSNTLVRENLSVSYIVSGHHRSYTELGYGLSEIFLMARIGVYFGFDDLRYRSAGVSITLDLN